MKEIVFNLSAMWWHIKKAAIHQSRSRRLHNGICKTLWLWCHCLHFNMVSMSCFYEGWQICTQTHVIKRYVLWGQGDVSLGPVLPYHPRDMGVLFTFGTPGYYLYGVAVKMKPVVWADRSRLHQPQCAAFWPPPPCPHSGMWYQLSFPRSLQSPCVWDAVSTGLRWDRGAITFSPQTFSSGCGPESLVQWVPPLEDLVSSWEALKKQIRTSAWLYFHLRTFEDRVFTCFYILTVSTLGSCWLTTCYQMNWVPSHTQSVGLWEVICVVLISMAFYYSYSHALK